jgi:hypothetical protein
MLEVGPVGDADQRRERRQPLRGEIRDIRALFGSPRRQPV